MKRSERVKEVNKILSYLKKKGLNIEFATQGKSVEKLAFNKTTFNIFLKFVDRAKELPKTRKENKKYDIKFKKKQEEKKKKATKEVKKVIKDVEIKPLKPNQMLNNKTGSALIFNYKLENTSENAINKTREESIKFLNTYFKPVKDHAKVKKRIENIQERLGTRLDLLFSMIDEFSQNEYKYPFHKEEMKKHMTDEYEKGIINRLDDIEDILTEYGL